MGDQNPNKNHSQRLPQPTERFHRLLAFASDEADALGHGFITCQHLVVALSRESKGLARAVLDRVGVTPEALHKLLAESAALHDRTDSHIDLAAEAHAALDRAVRAAQAWGHRVLDTEHVLYGILSESTSADELLASLRIDPSVVLSELAAMRQAAPPAAVRDEATHAYRFTLESAWLLSMAMDIAREHNAAAINSLHLLAALLSVESPARTALAESFGLNLDRLRRHMRQSAGLGTSRGRLPLGEDVQRILGYAIGEAWNRGHLAVAPLHLATGLARAGRHVALDVLADLGIPQAELADALTAAMPPPTLR